MLAAVNTIDNINIIMTDCIDREDRILLIENMQFILQTEQYMGTACVLVFGGMDTPDFGRCMPRSEKAIRNDCCIQYQTLVFTSLIYL